MSKGIRRSYMKKGTFEGKRVIVAACAAVAMVMGAMSVGASVSNPASSPKSSVSTLATAEVPKRTTTTVKSTPLSSKRTLEVRDFLQQQNTPLYTTPKTAATPKDVLSPALGLVNPALFMAQIVQLGQPPAQPTETPTDATASGNPSESTPEKGTSSPTPTDPAPPATTEPNQPTPSEPTPSDPADPPQTMNLQSTDPSSQNKQ